MGDSHQPSGQSRLGMGKLRSYPGPLLHQAGHHGRRGGGQQGEGGGVLPSPPRSPPFLLPHVFFQPNSKTSGPSISSHRMQLSLSLSVILPVLLSDWEEPVPGGAALAEQQQAPRCSLSGKSGTLGAATLATLCAADPRSDAGVPHCTALGALSNSCTFFEQNKNWTSFQQLKRMLTLQADA